MAVALNPGQKGGRPLECERSLSGIDTEDPMFHNSQWSAMTGDFSGHQRRHSSQDAREETLKLHYAALEPVASGICPPGEPSPSPVQGTLEAGLCFEPRVLAKRSRSERALSMNTWTSQDGPSSA